MDNFVQSFRVREKFRGEKSVECHLRVRVIDVIILIIRYQFHGSTARIPPLCIEILSPRWNLQWGNRTPRIMRVRMDSKPKPPINYCRPIDYLRQSFHLRCIILFASPGMTVRYKQTSRAGASDSRDILIEIGGLSVLDNNPFAITEHINKLSHEREREREREREIRARAKVSIKI